MNFSASSVRLEGVCPISRDVATARPPQAITARFCLPSFRSSCATLSLVLSTDIVFSCLRGSTRGFDHAQATPAARTRGRSDDDLYVTSKGVEQIGRATRLNSSHLV